MNEVTELPDGILRCSCGAKAQSKNRARFRRRHPAECSEAQKAKDKKKEFSKKLASGVRSVEGPPSEGPQEGSGGPQRIEEMLDEVLRSGIELTDWEQKFLDSIQEQFERMGKLSVKQVEILEQLAGRRD
jgi:hypothetical protein